MRASRYHSTKRLRKRSAKSLRADIAETEREYARDETTSVDAEHLSAYLNDVLAYKAQRSAERKAFFAESMRQAQEDGIFDLSIDDYKDALVRAKRRTFLRELTQETVADGTYFMTAAEADEGFDQVRGR